MLLIQLLKFQQFFLLLAISQHCEAVVPSLAHVSVKPPSFHTLHNIICQHKTTYFSFRAKVDFVSGPSKKAGHKFFNQRNVMVLS